VSLTAAITAAYAQRWDEALDLALAAAEAGDAFAGAQLATLAGEPGATDWKRLRGLIDAAHLAAPPQLQRLSNDITLAVAPAFATAAMCGWLIARAMPKLQPSTVNDSSTGETRQHPMRTAHVCGFGPMDRDLIFAALQSRAAAVTKTPIVNHEAPNVISYEPGQQFGMHVDFVDPSNPMFATELAQFGQRTVTIVTYLNDDFDDAPTQFPAIKMNVRGDVGDAIIWSNVLPNGAPDMNTVHAGMPPTRGRKWVLSQWLRNKPQPYNL